MNHFVNFYIDNVINAFRVYNESLFNVNIQGLGLFANKEDRTFAYLLSQLANYGFTVNPVSYTHLTLPTTERV